MTMPKYSTLIHKQMLKKGVLLKQDKVNNADSAFINRKCAKEKKHQYI